MKSSKLGITVSVQLIALSLQVPEVLFPLTHGGGLLLLLGLLAGNNIVNPQDHLLGFNLRFDNLLLGAKGVHDVFLLLVTENTLLALNTPVATGVALTLVLVLLSQLGHHTNDVATRVVLKTPRNDLELGSNLSVGVLFHALDLFLLLFKLHLQVHFLLTSTGQEFGLHQHVPGNIPLVMKVSLHLIEDITTLTAEDDGALFGVLAFGEEGEIVLTNLLHFKVATKGSHVFLFQLFLPGHDGLPGHFLHPVVVGLTEPPDTTDVLLHQEVLLKIRNALLRDHQVRFHSHDFVAKLLDLDFFLSEHDLPIFFLRQLHVGLRLTLLIFQGAIEQNNPGVLDLPAHSLVGNILVKHNTFKHLALAKLPTLDLLNFLVPFEVNLFFSTGEHGVDGQLLLDLKV